MAAYAALVSLFNNLDQIQNHPRFSASLDKFQTESLGAHINFLLDFVESYNIDGDLSKGVAQELKREITCAAHEAEDIIESHIVDIILPATTEISDVRLHHRCFFGLQKVIGEMDSIKEKVLKFKDKEPMTNSTPDASSTLTPLSNEQTRMVGFEEELRQLKDVVIGQQSSRQIISIVGMGGTGKTTLAKHVYEDSLTMHHFDLRAWATISQEYDVRDILLHLLSEADGTLDETLDELGERLYKKLFGRRYLIILDDVWSTEVWDRIKFFFPNNSDGSRIVLTTRLSNVATLLGSICIRINFLDGENSWNLFCQKVFGQEDRPVELEGIGKKIVEQCKGLPLSIVVIGGLLKRSNRTEEYWLNVAKNINAIFNSTENGQCLDVLYLSYSHLPAYLKPCFLYMGTFKEDSEIRVSEIINLWVAEGFLKPNGVQILEEMAEDYLKDLMDRNLILVCALRSNGKTKSFRMHDLLRDLCLRVAGKEEFFYVVMANNISRGIDRERRLIFHYQASRYLNEEQREVYKALQSASLARSLICNLPEKPVECRLLRVLNRAYYWCEGAEFQSLNLRYVACQLSTLPSVSLIWNLQTLVLDGSLGLIDAPSEIWKMTQLRHLKFDRVLLPDPPPSDDKDDSVVLINLQTLAVITDFRLSEEACKRISNIKKLCMSYGDIWKVYDDSLFDSLQNLGRLQRLESLDIWSFRIISISKLRYNLPSSLKKLSLGGDIVCYEDLSMTFGSLPQLEVVKVKRLSRQSQKWNCVEGAFLRLKFLSIEDRALESWTLDEGSCFPVLEKLVLIDLVDLNEIPLGIGEIPTLQLIRLEHCPKSLIISAMKIKEEQENFGNYSLVIQVKMFLGQKEGFRERVKGEGLSIENIHLEFQR